MAPEGWHPRLSVLQPNTHVQTPSLPKESLDRGLTGGLINHRAGGGLWEIPSEFYQNGGRSGWMGTTSKHVQAVPLASACPAFSILSSSMEGGH